MKREGCNCWEWPGLTGRKKASLSTVMFDSWPCSYWPSYLHCQHAHVTVIIRQNCRLYRFPSSSRYLPSLGGSWMFVRRHTSLFSLHTIAVKSSLVVTRMSPRFNLIVLGFRSLVLPFLFSLTLPKQDFFSGPSRQKGEGRKRSCPCIVYVLILQHSNTHNQTMF
jgi:hypothetical protein